MSKKSGWLVPAVVGFLCGLWPSVLADTVTITPDTAVQWSGDQNSNPAILGAVAGIIRYTPSSLYKSEFDGAAVESGFAVESGSFASSYNTVFSNTESDPSNAKITYETGQPFLGAGDLYLIVKDGDQTPAWYLFDLGDLQQVLVNGLTQTNYSWNGQDTLSLQGFWLKQGAISHVEIVGRPVPEPGAVMLLGLGLLAAGLTGRRR